MSGYGDLVKERDRLVGVLSDVAGAFDEYPDELADAPGVRPLRELATELKAASDDLLEKGRLLNLGIVGQIKAGKSTLLNLLLFDGQEVLPRAATPMTAALTHVVRSDAVGADQAEVDVEYYSPDEWRDIETHAREYRKASEAGRSPDGFLLACHQQVALAEERGIDATAATQRGADTHSVSIDALNELLLSVVGAGGAFTPLVKSVTIRCGQGFPDLDVVDTPGLNDPIVSRVRATHKLLEKCDAVLLLSYAGQFMDSSDVDLLRRTLPDAGIERCVVIGSKFDSALVDVARDHGRDLQAAVEAVKRQLTDRFRTEAGRMRGEDGRLRIDTRDVLFTSAMCAILSARPCANWSAGERDAFDMLRRAYPDWLDPAENGALNEATATNLRDLLGRREAVDKRISTIRGRKDDIIRQKSRDYLRQKRRQARADLDALIDGLKEDREELGSTEVAGLKNRKERVQETIAEIGDAITDRWGATVHRQKHGLDGLRESCREEISAARSDVRESGTTRTRSRRKSAGFLGLGWVLRALSRQSHEESYEETVLNEVALKASIDEALDKLDSAIRRELGRLFDPDFVRTAKQNVRTAVAETLDDDSASEIGRTVGRSLARAVEEISERTRGDIVDHHSEEIPRQFDVQGDTEEKQTKALNFLNDVSRRVTARLDDAARIVQAAGGRARGELVPVATGDLEAYHERLAGDIERREFKLQRYERLCCGLVRQRRRLAANES